MIKGVEVKTGDKYVQMTDYYTKNWEKSKKMWVKCFRIDLPLLGDNTTNRVESSFSLLKQTITDTFSSTPKTIQGIHHLVQFADKRLLERYSMGKVRRLVIFNSIPKVRDLNEAASYELNDRGCRLFNEALDKMEARRKDIEIIRGGVKETFADGTEKEYKTTERSCNCSYVSNHQAPCRHILFLRRLDEIEDPEACIFDKTLFHSRYYRRDLMEVISNPTIVDETNYENNNNQNPEVVNDEEVSEKRTNVMNEKSRFKMIMPIALSIANLASLHDTKTFLRIKEDLELVEKRIRRGNAILTPKPRVDDSEGTIGNMNITDAADVNGIEEGVDEESITTEQKDSDDTIPEEDYIPGGEVGKFNLLKFKESVKTKGRPKKKRNKQVTFNKTALDRKKKPKQSKKSTKKAAHEFIDDEEIPDASASESSLEDSPNASNTEEEEEGFSDFSGSEFND